MTTVTFETQAWITEYNSVTPDELQTPNGARTLTFHHNDMSKSGWTLAGTAKITLETLDRDALVLNKIGALKAQAKEIRAEASNRCNDIENQIQNLLAITHQPAPQ